MKMVDERLMKYVPKKAQQFVTVLYNHCEHSYSIYLDIAGEEYHAIADGVAEIRHAVNVMVKERRDYGM